MCVCVCVCEGMHAGESLDWARRVCESMLHMQRDKPVCMGEGQLQGVVRVNQVCMLEGVYGGWTEDAPGCSPMVLP